MRSTLSAALAAAAVLYNAAPSNAAALPGGSWFSLQEQHNDRFHGVSGLDEMLLAYVKYNVALTPELRTALTLNDDVPLRVRRALLERDGSNATVQAIPPPVFDREYVVPVSVGTPPQDMMLNLDTGSADLWVFSTDTPARFVNGQTLYSPGNSSTARLQKGQKWSIRYGDGSSADGIVYADRFQLGDTSFPDQMVQSATHVSDQHARNDFSSGILGLSRSSGNTVRPTPARTYFDNIRDQLARPVFASNLQRGRPGTYDFGYINASAYEGEIGYAPALPDTSYWAFSSSGFQIGNEPFVDAAWDSLADTGTTLWLLPGNISNAYWSRVPGARFDARYAAVMYPCEVELPSMTFGLAGGYRGVVPGHYLNHGRVNESHCYGGIQNGDGLGLNIHGGTVLKAQFVVFDAENDRVGWASKPLDAE